MPFGLATAARAPSPPCQLPPMPPSAPKTPGAGEADRPEATFFMQAPLLAPPLPVAALPSPPPPPKLVRAAERAAFRLSRVWRFRVPSSEALASLPSSVWLDSLESTGVVLPLPLPIAVFTGGGRCTEPFIAAAPLTPPFACPLGGAPIGKCPLEWAAGAGWLTVRATACASGTVLPSLESISRRGLRPGSAAPFCIAFGCPEVRRPSTRTDSSREVRFAIAWA
mmetsp:Transcript_3972/g.15940  ORF Transcript_3972/g.15940 Transcript_3972/m.15940 type:complete len:224 (+) Transcript_3972:431-1102(+)